MTLTSPGLLTAAADAVFATTGLALAVILCHQGVRRGRWLWYVLALAGFSVVSAASAAASAVNWPWAGAVRLAAAGFGAAAGVAVLRAIPRALAEQHARDSDVARLRLLEAAVAASGDGVVIAAADPTSASGLRIRYANEAFERITGYASEDVLGLSPSVLADGAKPDELEVIRAALRGGGSARLEVAGRKKDGTRVWTEWNVVPVAGAGGGAAHTVAVLRDATERRRSETALRESEAWFRGLFEQAADAMFLLDPAGKIVDANQRARIALGYTRDELTAMRLTDLGAEPQFTSLDVGETLTVENRYRRKDGTTFPIEVRYVTLQAGNRRAKLAMVRDVTLRRQAEQALREREELLRNVMAHIPCGVFWKDRESVFLGCNDQVARDFGLASPAQIVGRTDLAIGADPADAAHYRERDRQVIETGKAVLNAEENQIRPGGVRATLLTSKVPLRDAAGRVVGVLGVYQDITERKRLEEQFRQSQKMEAVGRLAGGVAHDFNNLLTIIQGNAELLRDATNPADRAELLTDLLVAADRAAALIRQLLMFGRRQPARPEVFDLNDVVAGIAGMLRRLLGERITVETRPAPGVVAVRADRSHLEQVVMNLAVNARDAMPQGGVLTITTDVVPGAAGAPAVRLSVSDTGCGMTDEVKARLFEPFFTTKGPDKGTGLGLATVFGIVQQAGGRIEVDSAPGLGATFRVDLPACDAPVSASAPTPLPVVLPTGYGRCVLLAEDEDALRKFARVTLEGAGYAVVDAPDAETALARLRHDRPPDVLVTDLTMPGMDGHELAERVRRICPGAGVVFMSGYVPEPGKLEGVRGSAYVPKPFTPTELLRAVGRVAAGGSGSHAKTA